MDSCIYYNNKAIDLAFRLSDSTSLGVYYSNQAQFLVNAHRFSEGLKSASKASELKQVSLFLLVCLLPTVRKAGRLKALGQLDSALLMYRKAHQFEKKGALDYASLHNIGSVLQGMGKLDSAEQCYRKSLNGSTKQRFGVGELPGYKGMASVLLDQNRLKAAKLYLIRLKSELLVYEDYRHFVDYYNYLTRYHIQSGNVTEAKSSMVLKDNYVDSLNDEERQARS